MALLLFGVVALCYLFFRTITPMWLVLFGWNSTYLRNMLRGSVELEEYISSLTTFWVIVLLTIFVRTITPIWFMPLVYKNSKMSKSDIDKVHNADFNTNCRLLHMYPCNNSCSTDVCEWRYIYGTSMIKGSALHKGYNSS